MNTKRTEAYECDWCGHTDELVPQYFKDLLLCLNCNHVNLINEDTNWLEDLGVGE